MKLIKGLSLTALLIAGSMTFIAPTQATTQASLDTPITEANITAPVTALSYEAPAVGTEAGTTQATTEATTQATTQAPAPDPTPIQAPAPALTDPTPIVPTGPTAGPTSPAEAPTEAPSLDDTAGYPAQPPAPTDLATAGPEVPTAGAICLEDEPCWNCSTMGNRICGLTEAIDLSGYTPERFKIQYVGLFAHSDDPAMKRFGNRYVQSATNPAYDYVFQMTIEESCADPATPAEWIAEWCTATK